ncbi:hypothetical protein KUV85_10980 [Nocardioides panacisoli]|uniref:hypothetical protein n=1 Tax=Nocardioides panacisoli TaxID=627624 RepID=UPI001C6353F6|nr:hypothetical protein [Nocardioides panacisoli]QYJ02857.1 hypothetical protein KUV85_10980 [Nocardioides panacisoli]
MPESADEVYARIQETVGPDGRLPMPLQSQWNIFPWEVVDGEIVPKVIPPPGTEAVRKGDDDAHPFAEDAEVDADRLVWEDEHWTLSHPGRPTGLPVVLTLTPKVRVDSGVLSDDLASEMGRIMNRLVRIIENLPHIGRVHVHRWGDSTSHLQVWFFARTEGLTNVLGPLATEWNLMIPPGSEKVWREDLHTIALKLANWGGDARA